MIHVLFSDLERLRVHAKVCRSIADANHGRECGNRSSRWTSGGSVSGPEGFVDEYRRKAPPGMPKVRAAGSPLGG
jgi:hypothetical protein